MRTLFTKYSMGDELIDCCELYFIAMLYSVHIRSPDFCLLFLLIVNQNVIVGPCNTNKLVNVLIPPVEEKLVTHRKEVYMLDILLYG